MTTFLRSQVRGFLDTFYLKFYREPARAEGVAFSNFRNVHYGCGKRILEGWLNLDISPKFTIPNEVRSRYFRMSLIHRHPFSDGQFLFGFSEDFLEHLDQEDSLVFLAEAYRTLKMDGVLRLSFPGLRGVLKKHFISKTFEGAIETKRDAYVSWGHRHFYSEESLELVAKHIGFRKVEFPKYGESFFPELRNLDSRIEQADLNLIVELIK